ncbi:MAG: carbamoyltransferase [Nitrospirales bacterium]|nr:MAG: carbamoyltransferase [Nitrospirales bacterium]
MTKPIGKLTSILGVSAYYHDSAACLIQNGNIVAAAQEERFTRKKHDAGFPNHAVEFCLRQGGVGLRDIDYLVFYDKPFVKFERLLETYLSYAPKGLGSFLTAIPVWIKEKLFLRNLLEKAFRQVGNFEKKEKLPPLLFGEHHESHAAAAFYPSPYEEAVVLCMDGVGEWATTSAWVGRGSQLTPLWEIPFPHSIGLLYSAFTYYTGFKVNSGEYKVMGLAPYGEPKYVKTILDNVVDVKPDGTFRLNMDYFDYCTGLRMTNNKFDAIFGGPPRQSEGTLTQREMDLARSVQEVTEMVMLRLANSLQQETGLSNLCLSGGVALNCVGNGRVLREGPFSGLWIQPAAGDAGSALGAALNVHYSYLNQPRVCQGSSDSMRGSYLGPRFSNEEIETSLQQLEARYERVEDSDLYRRVAEYLAEGKVIGWLQGHMEFGPRALGGRSILGDPRSEKMQSVMNLKIKYRESFRPFAPSVLRERVSEYFEMDTDSPYMLLVAPVAEKRRLAVQADQQKLWGIDLLNVPKSDIPAVTHVDYSARVQTVSPGTNPRYYQLLQEFEKQTGCAVLINTSFNVRGEPIVCTPEDAYRCFMRTEMDVLVLENCLVLKEHQKPVPKDEAWMNEFELD